MDDLDITIEGGDQVPGSSKQDTNIVITDPEKDRYNTFGFISWWKQEVVRGAKILVIGAGALGNEVLKNLALMGVGSILVVDFDTIDDSNLSRSILFRASDKKCTKSEVAARSIHEINPDVKSQWLHVDINHDLGLGVYRRADVVMGCLDNREARLTINKSCWRLDKPWIDGAIQELLGIARVFKPNAGACYECTLTDEDYKIMSVRMSCNRLAHQNVIEGKVPTTPTISSIIGAVETQEALKILHGMPVQTGQGLVFNGLTNDIYTMEYPEKPDCMSHEIWEGIEEVPEFSASGTTAGELLAKAREKLGPTAYVEIPTYASEATCPACGNQMEIKRPLHQVTFDEAHCAKCGELMDIKEFDRLTTDFPFPELRLDKLGIPPLEILRAQTPDWQAAYLELTGDAGLFF